MPRHESVTDDYIAELKAGFESRADRVRTAPDWPETQKRMITGTYPYKIALERVNDGWTRQDIQNELGARIAFANVPNPIHIVGNRTIDEG